MNPMRLLIAVGVLAALGGFVYWSEENPPVLDDEKTPLVSLEKEDIRALTVERPGHDTITVVRGEDDEWKFAPPLAMPANESSVDLLLNNLTPMNSDRVVEEEITDWRPFGVEGEAWSLRVDVTAKKEDEDEKTYRVIFGNDTPTGSGVFARLEGDPRLFTVFNYVKSGFEKEVFDLREKKLLKVDQDKSSRVTVNIGSRSIEFGKSGDNSWQILKPKPLRADNFTVGDLTRSVYNAEMVSVLEEDELSGKYSFARPYVTVEVVDEAGAHTLTIAKDGDDKYFAKSSDLGGIYEVSSTLPEALDKPVDDFRNKKLFDFGFVDPGSIQLRDGDTRLTIAKKEDKWLLTSGGDRELDAEKVQTLLDALRGLTAKEFTSDEQADQAKFGLGAPTIEAEVQVGEGGKDKVLLTDPVAEQVYGAIAGQPSTYELEKGDAESLRNSIADVIAEDEEPAADEESEPES
jgi:hypothetical protein